jgi:hypothetical protein
MRMRIAPDMTIPMRMAIMTMPATITMTTIMPRKFRWQGRNRRGRSIADAGHGLPGHVHEATPAGVSWYQTNKGRLVLVTGACLAIAWIASLALAGLRPIGPSSWPA